MDRYDVVVVGAGLAGSTAAILLGRAGLRVALVERRTRIEAHKVLCTHFIQASATPTLRRLGLDTRIEEAGGVRNGAELWTRWGWVVPPEGGPHGYNIRREKLDPMVRELAARTSGVDLRLGERVVGLVDSEEGVAGVRILRGTDDERTIGSRLVVGADGHRSTVAKLAGSREAVRPNERFAFFAHYTGVGLSTPTRSQMWFLEPEIAYTFPNDEGITLLAAMPTKEKVPRFKEDPEGLLLDIHRTLPDGPDLSRAERVSDVIATTDYPVYERTATPGRRVALTGDALLNSDPLWGVGCGWAFQMGEWLADSVGPALAEGRDPTRALRAYRRRCRVLLGHQFLIRDFARARPYNAVERLMFSAAARDPACAAHLEAFGTRRIPVRRFLGPTAVARAAWVNLRHRFQEEGQGDGAETRPFDGGRGTIPRDA
jgi:menaquinone-9 beta-reductase